MNSFGRIFKVSIFGESHGNTVGILIDGVKPGISLSPEDFYYDLARRKAGKAGTTTRMESDMPLIETGVFNGYTTGAPLLIRFLNENTRSNDYSNLVTTPRPGHADYTAKVKYNGFNDYRGGGAFSGRLTLGLVAAGVVAKKMLGATVSATIESVHQNPNIDEEIEKACLNNDSVGGVVKLTVTGIKPGLGEPFFDSVESVLSHLIFSVGGVKGIEFGAGFKGEAMYGSEFNDCIIDEFGHTATNHNGGINGGITNGNDIVIRVFVKPTPSISKPQLTYNFVKKEVEELIIKGRHDKAIILRIAPVLEAVVAIGLTDLMLIDKTNK